IILRRVAALAAAVRGLGESAPSWASSWPASRGSQEEEAGRRDEEGGGGGRRRRRRTRGTVVSSASLRRPCSLGSVRLAAGGRQGGASPPRGRPAAGRRPSGREPLGRTARRLLQGSAERDFALRALETNRVRVRSASDASVATVNPRGGSLAHRAEAPPRAFTPAGRLRQDRAAGVTFNKGTHLKINDMLLLHRIACLSCPVQLAGAE
ncbi:unnamed protein product, partial [Prorocentrum cordatum]